MIPGSGRSPGEEIRLPTLVFLGFPGVSDSKESPCNAGDLGWEDPLEEGMATQSSILAWRIPWTEELGGSQRVRPSERLTHTNSFILEKGTVTHSSILAWRIPWTL